MKKKVMAVVLAGIMVLTAACGSKSPSEDSASQAVSEEEASLAPTPEWRKASPKRSIHFCREMSQ